MQLLCSSPLLMRRRYAACASAIRQRCYCYAAARSYAAPVCAIALCTTAARSRPPLVLPAAINRYILLYFNIWWCYACARGCRATLRRYAGLIYILHLADKPAISGTCSLLPYPRPNSISPRKPEATKQPGMLNPRAPETCTSLACAPTNHNCN